MLQRIVQPLTANLWESAQSCFQSNHGRHIVLRAVCSPAFATKGCSWHSGSLASPEGKTNWTISHGSPAGYVTLRSSCYLVSWTIQSKTRSSVPKTSHNFDFEMWVLPSPQKRHISFGSRDTNSWLGYTISLAYCDLCWPKRCHVFVWLSW